MSEGIRTMRPIWLNGRREWVIEWKDGERRWFEPDVQRRIEQIEKLRREGGIA